jgi:hypothetical protein
MENFTISSRKLLMHFMNFFICDLTFVFISLIIWWRLASLFVLD